MGTYLEDCKKQMNEQNEKIKQLGVPNKVIIKVGKFVKDNYRHDRLYGRGKEYGDLIISSHILYFIEYGIDIISHFEAACGDALTLTADFKTEKYY